MKKIYIVGGNGFARECYYYVLKMSYRDPSIKFSGFLGHGGYGKTVDYKDLQAFYLGEVSDHFFSEDEFVVIGAGYPEIRGKVYKELKKRGLQFMNVHVDGDINTSVTIGEANIFSPPFNPTCNIKIGNCNVFNRDVNVGHDVIIGDCNFFGPSSHILGSVTVGCNNIIGAGSVLLPHCRIGDNNKISPLSAVYKGCKNNCYLHGNPALKIGKTESGE